MEFSKRDLAAGSARNLIIGLQSEWQIPRPETRSKPASVYLKEMYRRLQDHYPKPPTTTIIPTIIEKKESIFLCAPHFIVLDPKWRKDIID